MNYDFDDARERGLALIFLLAGLFFLSVVLHIAGLTNGFFLFTVTLSSILLVTGLGIIGYHLVRACWRHWR